ncbi:hypothetical protein, partial [Prevotella sp.]|uniref:hypothetical protein n=1 Tax=Prevotella sp. TaxID=59823 RepID=UPI0025E0FF02
LFCRKTKTRCTSTQERTTSFFIYIGSFDTPSSYNTSTPQQDTPNISHANIAPVVKKCYKKNRKIEISKAEITWSSTVFKGFSTLFNPFYPQNRHLSTAIVPLLHSKTTSVALQKDYFSTPKGLH